MQIIKATEQWEYRQERVTQMSSAELNNFGKEGWELVAVFNKIKSAGGYTYFTYCFKRPLSTTPTEGKG